MLTEGERKYLATIPDDQKMVVKPFNPKGLEIANQVIADIKAIEPDLEVICIGSLPLKIAGQEDIDINAFCIREEQPKHLDNFKKLFGEPTRKGTNSIGWNFQKDSFTVDVWLTDPTAETTKAQVKVFNILKNNPKLLKEYEQIKLDAKDLSCKQYQIKKYEFYHRILGEGKALNALKWIVGILTRNNIPYCIGGGMAVYLYGSGRPVNDIDISISGKYFPIIVSLVKDYIVTGPKHYKNDKWDCTTLSLNYEGRDIDMTDADTLMMSKKDGTGWIKNKEIYQKYPNVIKDVSGINISLMDPRVLLEYKQELDGEHQEYDIKFLEQYIKANY